MSNDISHLLIEALEKGEVGLSIKKGSVVAEHVLRAGVSSVRMPHALRDIRASHRFDISGVVPTLSSELSLTAIDQNALVGDPFAGTVSHDYQLTTGEAA
jgi:hypothetical protein